MPEKWLALAGYEGLYEASSYGRIRSLDRRVKNRYSIATRRGRILRQTPDRAGYLQVHLSKDNVTETKKVHRLVAAAFIPTDDAVRWHVNHKDCVKSNNHVRNLEWCDVKENMLHASKSGRLDASFSSARAKKLTPEIVLAIRAANANGEGGCRVLGRRFGISNQTAQKILSRHIWTRI